MKKDIAIEEIRQVRKQISAEFGHDIAAMLAYYKSLEKQHRDKMLKAKRAVREVANQ